MAWYHPFSESLLTLIYVVIIMASLGHNELMCYKILLDLTGSFEKCDLTKKYWNSLILKEMFNKKLVDFLIGHYTYRIFPPVIDIIPTLLAVVYSNGKYTN